MNPDGVNSQGMAPHGMTPNGMTPNGMTTVLRVAGALLLGALLTGCAAATVGGSPATVTPSAPSETSESGTPYQSDCVVNPDPTQADVPVPTPTDAPLITVTQGTNAWIASDLTQPYAIAVYPDGTAIRAEDPGTADEPLPELTIGRIDPCRLGAAAAEFAELAAADLGDPQVTDQGTTTVTVHDPAGDVVIDVYALGIGDEYLAAEQRAARQRLTGVIDDLSGAMTQTATWTPDRVRVSLRGNPTDPTTVASWPLPGPIDQALDPRGGRAPCGVFGGAEAAAIIAELGSRPAGSSWQDGTQTVVLAVGVLVPGQDCASS